MTTQITPIPNWMFTVTMPEGYDAEADYSNIQNSWNRIAIENGDLGKRLQVYVWAEFMGIPKINVSKPKNIKILEDSGILNVKTSQLTNRICCYLFHIANSSPDKVPQEVFDLEFYKAHQKYAYPWIEKKMRHHNGDYTPFERLGQAALALPAKAVQFVRERTKWEGKSQIRLINWTFELPNLSFSIPEMVTDEDGKTRYQWPALDKGENLLASPKDEDEPSADDTTPVKENVEVAEEAPAPAPVEEPKAEEASEPAKPKTKRKPAAKKTDSKKPAAKGPKHDASGRFVKKGAKPEGQPDVNMRGPGGASGGGTGC